MNRKADLTCNSPFATVSVVVDSHNDKLNISSSAPTPTPIIRGTAPMNHPKAPRMTKPKKSPPAAKNRLKAVIAAATPLASRWPHVELNPASLSGSRANLRARRLHSRQVRNGFFLDLPGRHYRIASRCFERGDLKAYSEVDSRHLSGGSEAPENLVIGIARVRFPSIKRNFKIHGNQASERSDGNGRAGLVLPDRKS